MSTNKQKLELTWIGKHKRPRLEPRILLEDKALSYRSEAPGRWWMTCLPNPAISPSPMTTIC